MSGQTVTGLGLQFTDDNKHAYAYSGFITATAANTEYTMLEFTTNSEYINGFLDFCKQNLNQDDNDTMLIFFNDIQVYQVEQESSERKYVQETRLLIPPFTKVTLTVRSTGIGMIFACKLTGKVGMAPRVGN
ncbi:MAG: hypothetical protein [Circular genetic element sp.]|nr:MAG: hypothetical protein [Circular genetic element sp.]